jgi:hypothetical protein
MIMFAVRLHGNLQRSGLLDCGLNVPATMFRPLSAEGVCPALGPTQPPLQWVPWALPPPFPPRVQRPWRETNY